MADKNEENFKKVFSVLELIEQRLDGIDGRLDGIDGRLDGIDGRLDGIDGRLDGHDAQFERVIEMLVRHDNMMQNFVTKDEFNSFRDENTQLHDRSWKAIERLDCEVSLLSSSHDSLATRVSTNEVAIKQLQTAMPS